MTTRAQFQARAAQMLADAQLLLDAGRPENAYYLSGYAVEMALKAVIARSFIAENLPDKRFVSDVHSHDLNALLRLAQLQTAVHDGSPALKIAWAAVEGWSERSRYQSASAAEAARLLAAVGDAQQGVLPWLMTLW